MNPPEWWFRGGLSLAFDWIVTDVAEWKSHDECVSGNLCHSVDLCTFSLNYKSGLTSRHFGVWVTSLFSFSVDKRLILRMATSTLFLKYL